MENRKVCQYIVSLRRMKIEKLGDYVYLEKKKIINTVEEEGWREGGGAATAQAHPRKNVTAVHEFY